ncbi:MAG: hypothetical protein WCO52_00025 [bacterium]
MHALWTRFSTALTSSALAHWFKNSDILQITPRLPWKLMWGYVGFVAVCWVGGIAISFLKVHPQLKERIATFFWTNAILGVFLFFFRFQYLPILGMDAIRLIQEISAVVWIGFLIRYWRTDLTQVIKQEKVIEYKQKYLPKAKK